MDKVMHVMKTMITMEFRITDFRCQEITVHLFSILIKWMKTVMELEMLVRTIRYD